MVQIKHADLLSLEGRVMVGGSIVNIASGWGITGGAQGGLLLRGPGRSESRRASEVLVERQ